jgi:hypothetical protein
MPEINTPPADGTTGTDEPEAQTTTEAKVSVTGTKTFTQAELDHAIQERLARAKPADYDEAKAALEEKRKRDEGEKTALQKAEEKLKEEGEARKTADQRANDALRTAEIRIEALKQGGDEELIAMALAADPTVKVENGEVVGAKEAVEARQAAFDRTARSSAGTTGRPSPKRSLHSSERETAKA